MKPKANPGTVIVQERNEPKDNLQEIQEIQELIPEFVRAMNEMNTKKMAEIIKLVHEVLHDYMEQQ